MKKIAADIAKIQFNNDEKVNPCENYDKLDKCIAQNFELSFPEKQARFNKYKHKMSPWITNGILKSIHRRDNLSKKIKNTHCDDPKYEQLCMNLKVLRQSLRTLIREAKKVYYYTEFQKFSGDCKRTWNKISEVLNKNHKKSKFPFFFRIDIKQNAHLNGNNVEKTISLKISDKKTIADQFNVYFANIGPNLSNEIFNTDNVAISDYLNKTINTTFSMKCITDEYVLDVIKSLKSKDSTGNDRISSKLLKQMAPTIHSILRLIINQSINTGIFPEQLKLAIVKPLFKNKGDNSSFGNYRPISLLSAISKVFERIVFNQLYKYMDSNSLFLNSQYGFRKNHSTEYAALEFVDRIAKDIEAKKVPLSVFIDLSKAFDTLDHEILLKKLKYYGITGVALSWFRSYLSNRQQMVNFEGILSVKLELRTGVPQGSILGPLLFIIYMNDIVGASALFHDILFADDTSLISTLCKFFINVPQTINDHAQVNLAINLELEKLTNWLNVNKLSLNTDKTTYMVFQSSKSRATYNWLDLKINNKVIKRVDTFNFLGLTLNKQLNWNDHINSTANKISSTVGVLNKLKNFLPINVLKQIYSSLILPRLYYCNLIWG